MPPVVVPVPPAVPDVPPLVLVGPVPGTGAVPPGTPVDVQSLVTSSNSRSCVVATDPDVPAPPLVVSLPVPGGGVGVVEPEPLDDVPVADPGQLVLVEVPIPCGAESPHATPKAAPLRSMIAVAHFPNIISFT